MIHKFYWWDSCFPSRWRVKGLKYRVGRGVPFERSWFSCWLRYLCNVVQSRNGRILRKKRFFPIPCVQLRRLISTWVLCHICIAHAVLTAYWIFPNSTGRVTAYGWERIDAPFRHWNDTWRWMVCTVSSFMSSIDVKYDFVIYASMRRNPAIIATRVFAERVDHSAVENVLGGIKGQLL